MAQVFESQEVSGLTFENPVEITHNLGYIPSVYSIWRVVSGTVDGFPPFGEGMQSGVYVDSFDTAKAVVKCRDGYSFEGNIKLMCWN